MIQYPSKVRIKGKVTYQVGWVDEFKDGDHLGQCFEDEKMIVIRTDLSPTLTFKVFIHEILHAIEYEYKIAIPHHLIHKLEHPIANVLKLNGWV